MDGVSPLHPPAALPHSSHLLPTASLQLRQRHKAGAECHRKGQPGWAFRWFTTACGSPPARQHHVLRVGCWWERAGYSAAWASSARSLEQDQAAGIAPSITPTAGRCWGSSSGGSLWGAWLSPALSLLTSNQPSAKRSFCLPPPSLACRFLNKCFCCINHIY